MKEGDLISDIFKEYHHDPTVRARRMNTGKHKIKGFWLVYGEVGQPDMELLVAPYGRLVGIECKSKIHTGYYKIGPKKR